MATADDVNECAVQVRESFLADLGELAGPLTHEVNNFLHTLTLHFAMWQEVPPADLRSQIKALSRQMSAVSDGIVRFQRRRQRIKLEPILVDLNAVLNQLSEELRTAPMGVYVIAELDPDLPPICGFEADIRRLCRFLLNNAAGDVAPHGPPVRIRTGVSEDKVTMEIEDAGPSIGSELLTRLFEPGPPLREGMCRLELAGGQAIVRRLQGNIRAASRPGGGLIMRVQIPKAEPKTR